MAAAGVGAGEIAAPVGHADGGVLVMRPYRNLFPGSLTSAANRLEAHMAASVAAPMRQRRGISVARCFR
jgi:hypothetical protein